MDFTNGSPSDVRQNRLRAGDVLLYSGKGFIARAIQIKTFSRINHIEVYDGAGKSVASRDGLGVDRYDYRALNLARVLRPRDGFNIEAARAWFRTVQGQPYDWIGLFAFFNAKRQGAENWKMFCSEFAVRFMRAGGVEPFTKDTDADSVAPGEFAKSGAFTRVWDINDRPEAA
ncbi:MAG TPA: hypothetical protein VNJ02_10495 [Vicinamibacterales bacterium]|nr:hypothetical protein [Vicinamibacterales bacterium]